MIFSSMNAHDDTTKYPKGLRIALNYLSGKDFTKMEPGKYPIIGKEVYALVMDITTAPGENKRAESHKKYMDIQFIVQGREKQGFAPLYGNETIIDSQEEKDIYFYENICNESFLDMKAGCYSVYFPNDIHRPGCMIDKPCTVRKVVVKVSMNFFNSEEE